MAANALEIRMAHLEGAYEQIDKRLASIERQMSDGFAQVRAEFGHLRGEYGHLRGEFGQLRGEFGQFRGELGVVDRTLSQKIDANYRWVMGLILLNWITIMLAIYSKHP